MEVLKFGAIWCSGCLVMKPRWEKIEKEMPELKTTYYDIDENEEIVKKYKIVDYPTFIFLSEDGREVDRLVGEVSEKKLIQTINSYKDQ